MENAPVEDGAQVSEQEPEQVEPTDVPEAEAESTEVEKPKRKRGFIRGFFLWVRETGFVLILALALSVFLRTFVFQAFYVPSPSMENTLLLNDRIIASKLSLRFGDLHRGDVIVFQDPSHWLPDPYETPGWRGKLNAALTWIGVLPANSGRDLVKRVIGMPGDHVTCCDGQGRIMVNGYSLDESAYVVGRSNTEEFDVVVPAGRVFVMGDNREHSADSRFHLSEYQGTVPLSKIVGQVVLLVWPTDRFTTLPNSLTNQPIPAPTS